MGTFTELGTLNTRQEMMRAASTFSADCNRTDRKRKYGRYKQRYTNETYRYVHSRKIREDPISLEDLGFRDRDDRAFAFEYMWNPYTGERTEEKDPYGPIYFNPLILSRHFYESRAKNLWIQEYECLGPAAGIGPEFEVVSRGKFLEWYLFRLPIIDCYLPRGQIRQAVSMGPRLTHNEVSEIGRKADAHWSDQQARDKYWPGSTGRSAYSTLTKVWELWHRAVSDYPVSIPGSMSSGDREVAIYSDNRYAVGGLLTA